MTLKRFGPAERCDFPKWFKEPKHWHSLNGELSYNVHQKYVSQFNSLISMTNDFYFYLSLDKKKPFFVSSYRMLYCELFKVYIPSFLLEKCRPDGTIHITKEKPTQRLESRAVCEQINKQTANETIMVVEQTTGWYVHIYVISSLFIILMSHVFFKRTNFLIYDDLHIMTKRIFFMKTFLSSKVECPLWRNFPQLIVFLK